MRVTVLRPKTIIVKAVFISVPVHYKDEDIPYDFPFRENDQWEVLVDIDSGWIYNWPGLEYKMDMKVTDGGRYYLHNDSGQIVAKLEEDYVPGGLIPEGGDYLVLDIGADGVIKNWPKNPDVSKFFPSERGE